MNLTFWRDPIKTARSIAKGTAKRLVIGAQMAELAVEAAVQATTSAAQDSILSSKTALGAYSMFQAAKISTETGTAAVITAVTSRFP